MDLFAPNEELEAQKSPPSFPHYIESRQAPLTNVSEGKKSNQASIGLQRAVETHRSPESLRPPLWQRMKQATRVV